MGDDYKKILQLNSTETGTEITQQSSLHETAKQPTPTIHVCTSAPNAYMAFQEQLIQSE